jgi:hypothetical protein
VSMRDPELCSGSLQEPDGVHLKPKGYVHMWEKALVAAGYTPSAPAAPALASAQPAPLAPAPAVKIAARIPLPIPRRPLASDMRADITGSIARTR